MLDRIPMRRTDYWLILAIISVSFPLMTILSHSSYTVPPSACDNRVDAKIVSLKIKSNGKTIDVLSRDGAIIDASIKKRIWRYKFLFLPIRLVRHTLKVKVLSGLLLQHMDLVQALVLITSIIQKASSTKKVSLKRVQMGQAADGSGPRRQMGIVARY